jgi:hypothetical protein
MALTQVDQGLLSSTAQYTGFKNRIINGAMVIDQRNAGASVTVSSDVYTIDRWQAVQSQASKYTVQQNAASVTPPTGFINYLGATSSAATSLGASDYFFLQQIIEGLNIADLAWGTANASTVTLSFWVRSSLTGTFGGSLANSSGNRSYPYTFSISSANTWEQKSITIAGDTSGTWLTTNGSGIKLRFGLGVGTTYSGTASAWAGANYFSATGATSVVGTNGATFYITGVQLEKGSTATSFDYRPYGTELALCQRYYWQIGTGEAQYTPTGAGVSENTFSNIVVNYPVKMRAVPTFSFSGLQCFDGSTAQAVTSTRVFYGGLQTANTQLFHGALVTGRGVYCFLNATSSYAAFNSEL